MHDSIQNNLLLMAKKNWSLEKNLIERLHRMLSRKWRETKQQPSLLPGPAVPGCCLVFLHFLCYVLCSPSICLKRIDSPFSCVGIGLAIVCFVPPSPEQSRGLPPSLLSFQPPRFSRLFWNQALLLPKLCAFFIRESFLHVCTRSWSRIWWNLCKVSKLISCKIYVVN